MQLARYIYWKYLSFLIASFIVERQYQYTKGEGQKPRTKKIKLGAPLTPSPDHCNLDNGLSPGASPKPAGQALEV